MVSIVNGQWESNRIRLIGKYRTWCFMFNLVSINSRHDWRWIITKQTGNRVIRVRNTMFIAEWTQRIIRQFKLILILIDLGRTHTHTHTHTKNRKWDERLLIGLQWDWCVRWVYFIHVYVCVCLLKCMHTKDNNNYTHTQQIYLG